MASEVLMRSQLDNLNEALDGLIESSMKATVELMKEQDALAGEDENKGREVVARIMNAAETIGMLKLFKNSMGEVKHRIGHAFFDECWADEDMEIDTDRSFVLDLEGVKSQGPSAAEALKEVLKNIGAVEVEISPEVKEVIERARKNQGKDEAN